jgi:hypothetical protein
LGDDATGNVENMDRVARSPGDERATAVSAEDDRLERIADIEDLAHECRSRVNRVQLGPTTRG